MKYLIMAVVAGAFAFASCAVETPTESVPAPLAKTVKELNWDVTIGLEATAQSCAGGYGYIVDLSGVNNVTHLGRTTGSGDACVSANTFTPPPTLRPIAGNAHMEWVLTAANGDDLWLELDGTWAVDLTVTSGVVINQAGEYTITGGTGRFEDASGSGTYEGVQYGSSAAVNYVTATMTGTLEY